MARMVIAVTVALIMAQAVLGVARIRSFDDRRSAAETVRPAGDDAILSWAGTRAEAFTAFRRAVRQDGRRFALVFGADLSGADRRTLAVIANAYFFPAVAVAAPADADVLVVFGDRAAGQTDGFDTLQAVGDGWLGGRSR